MRIKHIPAHSILTRAELRMIALRIRDEYKSEKAPDPRTVLKVLQGEPVLTDVRAFVQLWLEQQGYLRSISDPISQERFHLRQLEYRVRRARETKQARP